MYSRENVYTPVRSSGVFLFIGSVVIAPKILITSQEFKKVVHLRFIIIVVGIIIIKFWIGIMLHKWTKTGIQKVFKLKL